MSAQRVKSTARTGPRPIGIELPGLPWWGAIVIAVTTTLFGIAFDAGLRHKELTGIFAVLYALGCLAAVLAVRRSGVFTAVIQPPLILFVAVPTAYWLFRGVRLTDIKGVLINCGYPLIERFPLMLFTSAGVLLIGLARWYLASQRDVVPEEDGASTTATTAAVVTATTSASATVQWLAIAFRKATTRLTAALGQRPAHATTTSIPARQRTGTRSGRARTGSARTGTRSGKARGSAGRSTDRSRHVRPAVGDAPEHRTEPPRRRRPPPAGGEPAARTGQPRSSAADLPDRRDRPARRRPAATDERDHPPRRRPAATRDEAPPPRARHSGPSTHEPSETGADQRDHPPRRRPGIPQEPGRRYRDPGREYRDPRPGRHEAGEPPPDLPRRRRPSPTPGGYDTDATRHPVSRARYRGADPGDDDPPPRSPRPRRSRIESAEDAEPWRSDV